MTMCLLDYIYIGCWATIGSVLGFFAFRRDETMNTKAVIKNCCLSVGIGLLIAYALTAYLREIESFSNTLSMRIAAIGAFGIPDLVLKNWSKVTGKLMDRLTDRLSEKIIEKTSHYEDKINDG